ncbi:PalH/RIM21 [Cordyceps militaris CM01]|uniref:PalH/RIM21 n=1 Tax=Cordyceps militaris (strain CM01) TaxID=983644 RepID=G3J7E0_CORMM|nr:PalH/RIM21 [Cordyceps militaris CM01]EGX96310.1 PalH/RIM21 [Cordyceps militaris CM01]
MVSVDVAASATLTAAAFLCTSTLYPAFGVITLPDVGLPVTLAEPLVLQVPCVPLLLRADSNDGSSSSSSTSITTTTSTASAQSKQGATTGGTPITTSPAVATGSAEAAAATNPTTTDDGNITISDIVLTATTGTPTATATLNFHNGNDNPKNVHISSFGDPFYLSTSPIIYALSATTIVSWMLVIALFITTRSTFDGGIVYLGSRGSFTGTTSAGVSIGGRPWLQKIAALTVAISLTIATADTMSIVKDQYVWGITNARELQRDVMSRLELKVIRIISDTFLWLAQAQTLIRLFPRHREKVVIKWVAFALISLDIVFSSLNSFPFGEYDILNGNYVDPNDGDDSKSNKGLAHPIPAISYVFKLSLGLLYFFWVSYYAFLKRRYAFYHPLMKNISLVAVISLLSITVPIVFFILDISKPNFTAWGDYVRWVGAAAASVVVWEWVERIEALEREEKKDGVLGREVYDGDDMLEINAAEYPWRHKHGKFGGSGSSGGSNGVDLEGGQMHHRPNGYALGTGGSPNGQAGLPTREHEGRSMGDILRPPIWSQRAAQAATPVSRTNTPSAASTVYAVRYQGESRTPEPPIPYYTHTTDLARQPSGHQSYSEDAHDTRSHNGRGAYARSSPDMAGDAANTTSENSRDPSAVIPTTARVMRSVSYSHEPEAQDVADEQIVARSMDFNTITTGSRGGRGGRWDIRGRLEDFAASQADHFREKFHPSTDTEKLPVTVVPAPSRVGAALQQVLEEDEGNEVRRQQQQPTQQQSQGGSVYGGSSAIDAAASTASERYANGPARPAAARSRPQPLPLPVNQPPLWPGVHRRAATYDEEEEGESFDGEEEDEDEGQSTTDDLSSVLSRERPGGSSASRAG